MDYRDSRNNTSSNNRGKGRIWLNRLTALMVLIIFILIIVFVIKACSMRFGGNKKSGETAGVIVNTLAPASSVIPSTSTPEQTPDISRSGDATDNFTTTPTDIPFTSDPDDYTEITVLSAGDIMFHMAQVRGAYVAETDTYDFWPTYQYVAPIVRNADLAVVNFESTLYDTNYSGYPGFNSPVSGLQAIKDAGFDTLLFANNHCFDKELVGVKRTIAHFREYGFSYAGATDDLSKDKTLLLDVNGIKVGIINYSDNVSGKYGDQLTVNDLPVSDSEWEYLNLYVHDQEAEYLYPRAEKDIKALRSAGADIIIAYMHWGNEYEIEANDNQKKAAQKLCDLGVDCIIGGHPHVVQGMDIYKSSDGSRETVCFYSLGNYVSNQNRLTLPSYDVKEYTENGLMVKLYIRKYADGRTVVSKLESIPTWVHRYAREDGLYSHEIIPLPVDESEYDAYGLTKTSFGVTNSKQSFERTSALLNDKIKAYNDAHS